MTDNIEGSVLLVITSPEDYIVSGYSCPVVGREELMSISLDDTGLACAQVPNNQNLIQVFFLSLDSLHTHTHTHSRSSSLLHTLYGHTLHCTLASPLMKASQYNPPLRQASHPQTRAVNILFLFQYSTSAIVRSYYRLSAHHVNKPKYL